MIYLILLLIFFVLIDMKYRGTAVPVILYHQINGMSKVKPEDFEEHLKIIKLFGLTPITVAEAGRIEKTGQKLPKKSVIITLDDGYFDNFLYVFPILARHKIAATIFLNTGYMMDRPRNNNFPEIKKASDANREAASWYFSSRSAETPQYLVWEEAKKMHDSGLIDFQLHTHLHKSIFCDINLVGTVTNKNIDRGVIYIYANKAEEGFPLFNRKGEMAAKKVTVSDRFLNDFRYYYFKNLMILPENEKVRLGKIFIDNYVKENKAEIRTETNEECENRIREEIKINKTMIEEKLGKKAEYFAWPWGDENSDTREMIKKEGVFGFATCIEGTNNLDIDMDSIKRIEIKSGNTAKFIITILISNNIVFGTIYGFLSKGFGSNRWRKK